MKLHRQHIKQCSPFWASERVSVRIAAARRSSRRGSAEGPGVGRVHVDTPNSSRRSSAPSATTRPWIRSRVDIGVVPVGDRGGVTGTDPVLTDSGRERAGRFALRVGLSDRAVSEVPPSHSHSASRSRPRRPTRRSSEGHSSSGRCGARRFIARGRPDEARSLSLRSVFPNGLDRVRMETITTRIHVEDESTLRRGSGESSPTAKNIKL